MIDTMSFSIPISTENYENLISRSIMTQRIDKTTGEIEFEFSSLKFHPSWEYNPQCRLGTKKWAYDLRTKQAFLEDGHPHLQIEFSVPKVLFGHNCYSVGIPGLHDACCLVAYQFKKVYGVDLGNYLRWFPTRVDVCGNFLLSGVSEVQAYIRYMQRHDFSRRSRGDYQDECIHFASRVNTFKVYAKGPEFKVHDHQKIKASKGEIEAHRLQGLANKILRFEVGLRNRLKYIYNAYCFEWEKHISEFRNWSGFMELGDMLDIVDFNSELERMINKFMLTQESKAMKTKEVYKRFEDTFGARQGRSFYAVYCMIITQGMKEAKRMNSKNLVYRTVSAMRELGIGIVASDLHKLEMDHGFPQDLSFKMSDENKYYQVPIRLAA